MSPQKTPRRFAGQMMESLETRRLMSTVTLHPSGGDDTGQINSAIKNSHPGDTIDFASGNYNISSVVNFTQQRTYQGQGSAVLNWNGSNNIQAYFTGSNTSVSGLTFNKAGVLIENTNSFNFSGNSFTNIVDGANGGDALLFSNLSSTSITNNNFSNINNNLGIDGYNPNNSHIDGNTFSHVYEPIHIFFSANSASNNTVSGNSIQYATRFGIELQGAPSGLVVNGNWMNNWLPHPSSSGTDSHMGISSATGTQNGVYATGVQITNNYFGSSGIPAGFATPGGGWWNFSAVEIMGSGSVVSGNYIDGWGQGAMDGNSGPGGWQFTNNILVGVPKAYGSESGGSAPTNTSGNQYYSSGKGPAAPSTPNFSGSTSSSGSSSSGSTSSGSGSTSSSVPPRLVPPRLVPPRPDPRRLDPRRLPASLPSTARRQAFPERSSPTTSTTAARALPTTGRPAAIPPTAITAPTPASESRTTPTAAAAAMDTTSATSSPATGPSTPSTSPLPRPTP